MPDPTTTRRTRTAAQAQRQIRRALSEAHALVTALQAAELRCPGDRTVPTGGPLLRIELARDNAETEFFGTLRASLVEANRVLTVLAETARGKAIASTRTQAPEPSAQAQTASPPPLPIAPRRAHRLLAGSFLSPLPASIAPRAAAFARIL